MTLSEQLAELSKRAKAVEARMEAARTETRAQLDADLANARAEAKMRNEKAKARAAQMHDDLTAHWTGMQAHVRDQFDQIHRALQQKREEHDVKVAEHSAERAEWNAEEAIDFAEYAIDEAEASVLEAIYARQAADLLAHPVG